MTFVFFVITILVLLARRPIFNQFRKDKSIYQETKMVEIGLLIFSFGAVLSLGLAEGKIIDYKIASYLFIGTGLLSFILFIFGIVTELRDNFFGDIKK